MRLEQVSSIVFVGQFPSVFLDERELFGGSVDKESIFRAGPVLRCSFDSGNYQLILTPDRLDLKSLVGSEIPPSAIVNETQEIAKKIYGLRSMIKVKGIGFNHDGAISESVIGMNGMQYCNRLISQEPHRILKIALGWLQKGIKPCTMGVLDQTKFHPLGEPDRSKALWTSNHTRFRPRKTN